MMPYYHQNYFFMTTKISNLTIESLRYIRLLSLLIQLIQKGKQRLKKRYITDFDTDSDDDIYDADDSYHQHRRRSRFTEYEDKNMREVKNESRNKKRVKKRSDLKQEDVLR